MLSFFFYFYQPTFRLRLLRNFTKETSGLKLQRSARVAVAYKRFNCFLPDPLHRQIKVYLNTRARRTNFLSTQFQSQVRLSDLKLKTRGTTLGFYSSAKTRYRRSINYRRSFKLWQRDYFRRVKSTFYSGKSRPYEVRRLLQKFVGKRLLSLTLHFKLHPVALVGRAFPFFDRFLIKSLIENGLVLLNYQPVKAHSYNLQVNDFLTVLWSPQFQSTYKHWIIKHRAFLHQMGRNFHLHHKARRLPSLNRHKNYYRRLTLLPNLYRQLPSWLEVSYLTLSCVVVHMPRRPSFASANFNPYLNRLLGF